MAILLTICDIIFPKRREGMFYIKKNASTESYEICLFGIKMKLHTACPPPAQIKNLLYELADPRTLQNIKLPNILNLDDSLEELISSGKSVARYGDGEFKLIMGENIGFQKSHPELTRRLKEILKCENENVLIGIVDVFGYCPNNYMKKVIMLCRETLYKYINFDKTYVDASLARRFKFNSEEQGNEYYKKIKSLWNNKDIIIVEGAGSRLGIGNDLFDNANSIERILCPIKNAFSKYDTILAECLKQPKEKLFVLALGPTATLLAVDLAEKGYRALDIGHLDTCYETFLRKADKFVPIEGKIVFNSERYNCLLKPCKDEDYNKQIIARFK